jgi:uncharacterized metal-binding protein
LSELILVIPCSGIGKAFGTIGREATYIVVEELQKGKSDTLCLSLITMGDEEALQRVKSHRCITIDGCPLECAKKNLILSGGQVAASFRVVDLLREYRTLKPQSVTFLDEDGEKLAQILAEKIALKIDEMNQEEGGTA